MAPGRKGKVISMNLEIEGRVNMRLELQGTSSDENRNSDDGDKEWCRTWWKDLINTYKDGKDLQMPLDQKRNPTWLRKMQGAAMYGMGRLSREEKEYFSSLFPSDEELCEETCWYNRAVDDVHDPYLQDPGCKICGFQLHVAQTCPSPLKLRKELQGKLDD